MKQKDYYDDEPVFYCTSCLSLAIIGDKNSLKCGECGAKSDKIDVTNIHKWSALYREKYGSDYVSQSTTIYDDLAEFYGEEAYATLDETEALRNGLIVRDCVNLRLQDIQPMRAKNDPLFRAKEYADFQTFVSITTPTIKDGWTVTSTTDYTLLEDYSDFDATMSKDDELRYLVELKGREKYKSNDFDTFLIDSDKIERMRAKMTDGVGGMVVEMFDDDGIAYIWTFGKSDQFNKVLKNAERNTTRQMGKTEKLMAVLPHADAHVRHFPIGEHRRNMEYAKQQFEI